MKEPFAIFLIASGPFLGCGGQASGVGGGAGSPGGGGDASASPAAGGASTSPPADAAHHPPDSDAGHASQSTDAGHGGRVCETIVANAGKACSQDSDCTVALHMETCCDSLWVGVARSGAAAFDAAERECRAIRPPPPFCTCVGGQMLENGNYPQEGQEVVAVCESGACKSVGGRKACFTTSCAAEETCCVILDPAGQCVYACVSTCPSVTCPGI